MPRVQGTILSNYENSFIIKSDKLWNKLPQNLLIRSESDRILKRGSGGTLDFVVHFLIPCFWFAARKEINATSNEQTSKALVR